MSRFLARVADTPGPDARSNVRIQLMANGRFFVYEEGKTVRVWDGSEWRGFGEAESYSSYGEAMVARRSAISKATGLTP